jgi:hypothetical protein
VSDYAAFALADDGTFFAIVRGLGAQHWAPFEPKPGPDCIGDDIARWGNVLGCDNSECPWCNIEYPDGSGSGIGGTMPSHKHDWTTPKGRAWLDDGSARRCRGCGVVEVKLNGTWQRASA